MKRKSGVPELRSCVKVEVAVLGSPSMIVQTDRPPLAAFACSTVSRLRVKDSVGENGSLMVSVEVKQH